MPPELLIERDREFDLCSAQHDPVLANKRMWISEKPCLVQRFAKFLSPFDETGGYALDAAAEAMRNLDRLNADRARIGKPIAMVDLALHLGEVLSRNVGAVDRLDFTVIGGRRSTRSLGSRPCASRWRAGFSSRPNSPPRLTTKLGSSRSAPTLSEGCASPKRFSHCGSESLPGRSRQRRAKERTGVDEI